MKQTEKIAYQKNRLKEQIKTDSEYIATIEKWEKEKKDNIKQLEQSAKKVQMAVAKKEISEITQSDKSAIQTAFTDKVNLLKEELTEKYFTAKQNALDDYPIFMAIAEDIGYDATGRSTSNNELTEIGKELSKFISHINLTAK